MAEPVDPYAAIRRLQFYQSAPAWAGGVQERGDGSEYVAPMAAQWGLGAGPEDTSAYDAFRSSGFESKYGTPTISGDGNTMTLELQAPAGEGLGHKYDTMTAQYTRGADGQWTLSNDPRQQLNRQVSSGERWRDTAEAFAPMAAMAVGGGLYSAYGGGAGAAAGGSDFAAGAAATDAGAGAWGGATAGGGTAAGGAAASEGLLGGAGQAASGAAGETAGGGVGATTPGYLDAFRDWMRANPEAGRLLFGLGGGLLSQAGGDSGGGGGYQDSGYRPTITRGGWSPTASPQAAAPAPAQRLATPGLLGSGQASDGLWRYRGLLGGGR